MDTGDLVQIWFDTGALGWTICYGRVIASGPKTYRVRWESGRTNRIRQDDTNVARVHDVETATKAMRKVE